MNAPVPTPTASQNSGIFGFGRKPQTPESQSPGSQSPLFWGAAAPAALGLFNAKIEERKRREAEARERRKNSDYMKMRRAEKAGKLAEYLREKNMSERERKHRAELQALWNANGAALYEAKKAARKERKSTLRERALKFKEKFLNPVKIAQPSLAEVQARMGIKAQKDSELDSATRSYMAIGQAVEEDRFTKTEYDAILEKQNRPIAFMCTSTNPQGLPIPTQPALDWMIDFYRDNRMPGDTALERTKYLLDNTDGGRYTHFLNIPTGDSGFNIKYQDSSVWPSSDNQVGHYLTAVDISITVHSLPDNVQPLIRPFALATVIGHEMLGDTVRPAIGNWSFPAVGHALQGLYGVRAQILSLGEVNRWFLDGNDQKLQKILSYGPADNWDYFHEGNSIQDLKLSREGWNAGKQLVNGEFQTPESFADYLDERLR